MRVCRNCPLYKYIMLGKTVNKPFLASRPISPPESFNRYGTVWYVFFCSQKYSLHVNRGGSMVVLNSAQHLQHLSGKIAQALKDYI